MQQPQMLENRMVVDEQWEFLERNYRPFPPNRRERRLQRVIDEMEYESMKGEGDGNIV